LARETSKLQAGSGDGGVRIIKGGTPNKKEVGLSRGLSLDLKTVSK